MTGLEIASILLGMICGNLGAVVIKALNVGLFWNTICGLAGASGFILAQRWFGWGMFDFWYYDFLSAGAAGMALMLFAGAMTALRFRD